MVFKQTLLHDVAALGRAGADDQLARVRPQQLGAGRAAGHDAQRDARCGSAQARGQRGQKQVALKVVGGDGQLGLPGARVKLGPLGKPLHLVQHVTRGLGQGLGPGGGHDAAPALHKQRVTGDGTQLVQQVAYRRLGDAQALGRRRDAARLQHRQQQLDQVVAGFVVARVLGQGIFQQRQGRIGITGLGKLFGFLRLCLRQQFVLGGQVLGQELADLRLGQGAHEAVDGLTAGEHHTKRDGPHAKHLGELAGDFGLLVGIDLGQDEAAGVFFFQLFQHGAQLLAGAAPGGPDVQQNRHLQRGGDQVGFEIFEGDVDHGEGMGLAAFGENRGDRLKSWFCDLKESAVNSTTPLIGVVMGSSSDWDIMRLSAEILTEFGVPFEAKVVSAHRMPDEMFAYAETASTRGIQVIIAGAGGAAHLPGMVASMSPLPVIGVPVKSSNSIDGWDSVLSILQMPGGVPVATVALNGAKNAGILAAQIIGSSDKCVLDKIIAYKEGLKQAVLKASEGLK